MKKIIFLLSLFLITLSGFSQLIKLGNDYKLTARLIKIPSGAVPSPSTNFVFSVNGHLYWGSFRLDSIYGGSTGGLQAKLDTNRSSGYDATMYYVDSLLQHYVPKVLPTNPGSRDTVVYFDNGSFYLSSIASGGVQMVSDTIRGSGYDATIYYVDSLFYAGLLRKLNIADSTGNAAGNYIPRQQLITALLLKLNIADSTGNAPGNYVPHKQLNDGLAGKANTNQEMFLGITSINLNRGAGTLSVQSFNTDGTAGGLGSQYIDWTQTTGGASIANKPDLSTYAPLANPPFTGIITGVDIDITGNLDADSTISPGFIALGNCGAAITVYLRRGNTQTITRNLSTTVTIQGGVPGTTYSLVFIHEASVTAYTVTFSPALKWKGGVAPTFTNTSGAIDAVSFKCIGTDLYISDSGADFK